MLDYQGIHALAKEMRAPTRDLLAMIPSNDPFFAERDGRRREAEWFAEVCRTLGLGAGLHIRRVHYRASVSPPVPILKPDGTPYQNTHNDWMLMARASRDARYLSLVPGEWFVDRRNDAPTINAHFEPDKTGPRIELIGQTLLYEIDLPEALELPELMLRQFGAQQRYLVEVWVEKTTVHDVLEPLARRWSANLVTFKGEGSETACRAALDRARVAGRPLRILYLSDFDPGGRSMPVAIARKLEFWLRQGDPDLDVTVEPIALLPDQVERYRLPRIPIKETERRAAKFEASFGTGGVELDALEALHPGELREIVEAGILRHHDGSLSARTQRDSRAIYQQIAEVEEEVHGRYQDQLDAVQAEYSQLRQQLIAFSARAEGLWAQVAADLLDEAPYVCAADVPEPCEESDQLTPLFDSGRDYLTQLDWYRRWQGRGGRS